MALPKFFEMHRHLLEVLSDGKPHQFRECAELVAQKMNIGEEERKITISSGERSYVNRCGWSRTYMKKAGLITSPKTGILQITPLGQKALKEAPAIITDKYLLKYDSFKEFLHGSKLNGKNKALVATPENSTPEEILETTTNKLKENLKKDLLDMILTKDPYFFEKLVLKLLKIMGYGTDDFDAYVTQKSSDGGIDGVVFEDKLGFDKICYQAKRYSRDNVVGIDAVNSFGGALNSFGAKKGLFITTSSFTTKAIDSAKKQNIILVDGDKLASFMIDYELGVSTVAIYGVKKIDTDFFTDEE